MWASATARDLQIDSTHVEQPVVSLGCAPARWVGKRENPGIDLSAELSLEVAGIRHGDSSLAPAGCRQMSSTNPSGPSPV